MSFSTMTKRERILAATRCQPVDEVPVSTGYFGEWQNDWRANDSSYKELIKKSRELACGTYFWEPIPNHLVGTEVETLYSSDPVFCPFIYSYTSARIKVERKVVLDGKTKNIYTTIQTPKGKIYNICRVIEGIKTIWQPKHFITNDEELERFLSIPVEDITYDCSGFAKVNNYMENNGVVSIIIPDPLYYAADLFHLMNFLYGHLATGIHLLKL